MIVSSTTFAVIYSSLAAMCILPALYFRFIKKQGNSKDWLYALLILLLPINWFTPAIITVTSCNEYTKNVLLLPNSEFSSGMHSYIVNESDEPLYYENIVYGSVNPDRVPDDAIIMPQTSFKAEGVVTMDYILTEAPDQISTKGSGAVRHRISCDLPDFEYDDEEYDYEE